jgi:hypothetical protein
VVRTAALGRQLPRWTLCRILRFTRAVHACARLRSVCCCVHPFMPHRRCGATSFFTTLSCAGSGCRAAAADPDPGRQPALRGTLSRAESLSRPAAAAVARAPRQPLRVQFQRHGWREWWRRPGGRPDGGAIVLVPAHDCLAVQRPDLPRPPSRLPIGAQVCLKPQNTNTPLTRNDATSCAVTGHGLCSGRCTRAAPTAHRRFVQAPHSQARTAFAFPAPHTTPFRPAAFRSAEAWWEARGDQAEGSAASGSAHPDCGSGPDSAAQGNALPPDVLFPVRDWLRVNVSCCDLSRVRRIFSPMCSSQCAA